MSACVGGGGARNYKGDLLDVLECRVLALNFDARGVVHEPLCELHDTLGHGRRKERKLIVLRRVPEEGLDILDEAELQHLVSFVENNLVHAAEGECPAPHMVEQSSGRTDDELRMPAEFLLLPLDVRAAVDERRANAERRGKRLRDACDLYCQLAGRSDDERLHHCTLRFDFFQYGQEKGERLACTCLCLRNDVAPCTHGGNSTLLYGRRDADAPVFEQCAQRL